jgi:hypothetical protein
MSESITITVRKYQDPNNLNRNSNELCSLRRCLPNIVKFNWHDKLKIILWT